MDSLGSKVSKGDHHAVVITECLWHQHLWEGVERSQTVPQLTCEELRCWDTSSVLCHLEIDDLVFVLQHQSVTGEVECLWNEAWPWERHFPSVKAFSKRMLQLRSLLEHLQLWGESGPHSLRDIWWHITASITEIILHNTHSYSFDEIGLEAL